jgi:hypothetical protein
LLREEGESPPVDLGRGVRIDRLPQEEVELVMNACTPRGHYFSPIRAVGQRCSLIRDLDLAEYEEHPLWWDRDGVIYDALSLSRLVRDNGYSTEFAARITDYEDGLQTVLYTLAAESKHVYRLRRDREWLDPSEGAELRDLLAAYWAAKDDLPSRVTRAMWRTEYASWLKWADLVLPTLVGGLEALLKTERLGSTHQFVTRVPALAEELGIQGVDKAFCERIYDARSEWVHGTHVLLFATGQEAQEATGTQQGPQTAEQWAVFGEIARVQDLLRRAVRRCVEDEEFRAVLPTTTRFVPAGLRRTLAAGSTWSGSRPAGVRLAPPAQAFTADARVRASRWPLPLAGSSSFRGANVARTSDVPDSVTRRSG